MSAPPNEAAAIVRPRLLLGRWKVSLADGGISRVEGAVLHFGYGAQEFREGDRTPEISWEEEGVPMRARRDFAAEALALERLEASGLRRRGRSPVRTFAGDAFAEWVDFLAETADELRSDGWAVECAPGWSLVWEEPDAWKGRWTPHPSGGFELSLQAMVEGRVFDLIAICRQILASSQSDSVLVRIDQGRAVSIRVDDAILRLPAARMRPILSALAFFPEAARSKPRVPALLAARLFDLGMPPEDWTGLETVRATRLLLEAPVEPVEPPPELKAELRPYQLQGLAWLQGLRRSGLGGILADDMGLGKTLQTLAHLAIEHGSGRAEHPSLVVCPTSLLANWCAEAARFVPSLRVVVLHGAERAERRDEAERADIVLTTYPLLPRDEAWLVGRGWHLLVLDEAQTLKNSRAQARVAASRIRSRHRLALSGTPMENHLGEVWSLVDLVQPGLLGSEARFARRVRAPVERGGSVALRERLVDVLGPFLLRRTKEQVAGDLPGKTEIVQYVSLEGAQRDLYEAVRSARSRELDEILERRGWDASGLAILEALLRVRQVCCDPRLLPDAGKYGRIPSAKLEWLEEALPEMVEEGRRILLFSQFTSFLDLVSDLLDSLGVAWTRLDGSTRDRGDVVARFQEGGIPVFLLSLKAGGTGLNLTRADTVVFLDPWWNPAAERQAADRAHRIGQTRPVFVYRLVARNTIEERILALQERKSELADALLQSAEWNPSRLTRGELESLLAPIS